MKKYYVVGLPVFVIAVLVLGSQVHAYSDIDLVDKQIEAIQDHRTQMELKLGLDPWAGSYPHATSYYDDKEAHYEQDQIMADYLKGILSRF